MNKYSVKDYLKANALKLLLLLKKDLKAEKIQVPYDYIVIGTSFVRSFTTLQNCLSLMCFAGREAYLGGKLFNYILIKYKLISALKAIKFKPRKILRRFLKEKANQETNKEINREDIQEIYSTALNINDLLDFEIIAET